MWLLKLKFWEIEISEKILKLDNAPAEAQIDRIYMIDPAGNLMMSFPSSAEPALINKDIKRLLKASQIG